MEETADDSEWLASFMMNRKPASPCHVDKSRRGPGATALNGTATVFRPRQPCPLTQFAFCFVPYQDEPHRNQS